MSSICIWLVVVVFFGKGRTAIERKEDGGKYVKN
jgi:hypothetical protein